MDFPVYVVLPGGGVGQRFGSSMPKQFTQIMNTPLFLYTIHAFHRLPWIHKIAVVASEEEITKTKELTENDMLDKVEVVTGGCTRHRSIYNGVKALAKVCRNTDIVLIHDIVRVLAEEEVIISVAKAAKTYGAAGITRPLTSTVIAKDSDGFLSESLDRTKYVASEMPQGFHFNIINSSYQKASEYDFDFGTECLHLAMKYTETKVKLVEGPDSLWKVTYRKDFYAAEGMLKEKLNCVFMECDEFTGRNIVMSCIRNKKMKLMHSLCTTNQIANGCVFHHSLDEFENESILLGAIISKNKQCCLCEINSEDQCFHKTKDAVHSGPQLETAPIKKKTIVHLIDCNNSVDPAFQRDLRDTLLLCFCSHCTSCVSGVVYNKSSDIYKVGDMTANIFWNQDVLMHGQILFV